MGRAQGKNRATGEKPMENATLEGNEEYRCFIEKLADSNVDRYIDLPMIAVMGDTSSGKSSLLSNLSFIELPSSDELTTRCPIMLKMNHSDSKSATVQVVWKDVPSDQTSSEVAFTPEHFDESSWHQLTESIAKAQKHIVDISGKEVARDVVSVKIAGPHCENLTLIDLPGIVRSTGKGESKNLSSDIQSLIDDYLTNPRCVILAVHPSNVDFHNSQIMAEARKVDPETNRTIPVLTKPDLIDAGAENSVRDLLLGLKTDEFKKGFHMVKGRSQASLRKNESIESGLHSEEAFFRNTQPWRDVSDQHLFGTKNLRVKLSMLLMQLIRDTFPSVISELKREKAVTFKEYTELGDVPGSIAEKRIFYTQVKDSFVKNLRPLLLGGQSDGSIEKKCSSEFHLQCKVFQKTLVASKLSNISDVSLGANAIATDHRRNYVGKGKIVFIDRESICLDKVKQKDSVEQTYRHNRKVGETWEEGGETSEEEEEEEEDTVFQALTESTRIILHKFPKDDARADPEWIKKLIIENRPYALPVFINNELFEMIVSDFIKKEWTEPSLKLVGDLSSMIQNAIHSQLSQSKKLQRFPKFLSFMERKVVHVIDELNHATREKIQKFLKSEKIPYSQDHYLFENIIRMRSKQLENEMMRLLKSSRVGSSINADVAIQIVERSFERNQKKSVDDHMAEEMMVVLDAYGKVARKRVSDTVPMYCGEGLLHGFADRINEVLSVVPDEDLNKILSVPSDEEIRRRNLKRKVETLEDGMKAFDELF